MEECVAMNKMKIALVLQGGKGGTQEYLEMLLGKLPAEKYDVMAICHGEIFRELSRLGYNACCVGMERNVSIWRDLVALLKIIRCLKNNGIDLVYCHSSKAGILGRIAAILMNIPCVYNPHGWSFNMDVSGIKKWFYILVEKMAATITDKIIVISEAEYQCAVRKKIVEINRLELIVNGIDVKRFDRRESDAIKKRLNIPEHYKTVGMVARLTAQKAPQTFIKIAELVTRSYPRCKFLLVGDGEQRSVLEKMILEAKLQEKVILTGWVDNPEDYVSIFDVGVLTSRWEGFGLTLAEVMASGKPVVASEVDGIPYVVRKNIDGLLCDPEDIQAFGTSILRLFHNPHEYRTMSEAAYKHAREKYDSDRMIRQHEALFDSFGPCRSTGGPSHFQKRCYKQTRMLI